MMTKPSNLQISLLLCSVISVILVINIQHITVKRLIPSIYRTGPTSQSPSIYSMFTKEISNTPYLLSKRVLIRSAYFDERRVKDHHTSVVFFLEMERTLSKEVFIGCRIENTRSNNVVFHLPKQYYNWAIKVKHVTKNVGMVYCYIDSKRLRYGDRAYLLVHMKDVNITVEVRSQRDLVIPSPRSELNFNHPTVVSCIATVYVGDVAPSKDGMLYNWLRYQKAIGVDHVHMIAEDGVLARGYLDNPIIKTALTENYLSIDFWPRWFNGTEIFYHSQHLAYNDCLYRFQGVYDYIVFSDADDFFVPVKESKSIKSYLKRWCSGYKASCRFSWLQFYPDCGWKKNITSDFSGNLTAHLRSQKHHLRPEGKSAHQIKAVIDVGVHTEMELVHTYKSSKVPMKYAYFAHIRKGSKPSTGC